MSRTKTKRYLVLLAAVGLVAAALGGTGTFATFTADVTNSNNTFQTGTLVLSDTVPSVSTCYSNNGAGNSGTCAAIVDTGLVLQKPGGWISGTVTIKNEGSLASSDLTLAGSGSPTCTNTPGTIPGSPNTAQLGSGDLCSTLRFSLEKDDSLGSPLACLVGNVGPTACDKTLGTPLKAWLDTSVLTPFDFSDALTTGATRYYKVYLYLPTSADNTFQGVTAAFNLTWHIAAA